MLKFVKTLKIYYKLAGVKKHLIFFEFIMLLVPAILSILTTVYSANLITALTVYDFAAATKFLSINFAIIIISTISYLIYHLVNIKARKTIANSLHEYVYNNVKSNKNINNLSLSVLSGIESLTNLNKDLLYKLCFFIKAIVLLSIIIYYNFFIGLILITVSGLSYIFLSITNSKIKKNNKLFTENQRKTLELFNSIKRGSDEEQSFNFETALKNKYFKYANESIKSSNIVSTYFYVNNNVISLLIKIAVYGLTVYLISLIKSTTLTLSHYLILTPYLTSSAQNLIEFFEVFAEIGEADNTLAELESLKFQSAQTLSQPSSFVFENFNLTFYHTELFENNSVKLHATDFHIPYKTSVQFVGDEQSGKLAILNLLQKKIKPSSGTIFIDEKNIFDIDSNSYKKLVTFTSSSPNFFNISIAENLKMVCESKTKIAQTIKSFGLKKDIDNLFNGINTIINETFNKKLLFFLGIVRAYVSAAKIICINGPPQNFSATERQKFRHIINLIKQDCTVIFFSETDEFASLFSTTYYLEDAKIKNAKT